jgi:hypothetical protein
MRRAAESNRVRRGPAVYRTATDTGQTPSGVTEQRRTCKGLDVMKVEKTQFDKVIRALLSLPPMPMKTFEGKGRPKRERPDVKATAESQKTLEPEPES